jgi:hypothetical protein
MKKLASVAVSLTLCTIAWSSQAQEIKFGDKGTLAVHAATGSPMLETAFSQIRLGATPTLGFQTTTFSEPEECGEPSPGRCETNSARYTTFYLNPRIHFFPIDNLSIGGEILFATFSGKTITERTNPGERIERDASFAPTGFGIMPTIGYNIRISDKFSIWPHGGIGFRRFAWDPNPDTELSESWWFFNADVPFMLHIAPHFSIGAGPGATITLDQSSKRRFRGVADPENDYSTTMIRWFNAHLIGYF